MTKINPTGLMQKILESKAGKYLTNPASSAAVTIATISNLTKDGVNCAYYVTQSLNNERIPEDQRKFVAGLDLANGLLNVVLQAGVSAALATGVSKFFDKKIAPKHFSENEYKRLWTKVKNDVPYEKFVSYMEKNKAFAKIGLSVITTLVAMQVITKRIFVPLIATPLASVFKKQFEQADEKKKAKEEKDNKEDLQIAVA